MIERTAKKKKSNSIQNNSRLTQFFFSLTYGHMYYMWTPLVTRYMPLLRAISSWSPHSISWPTATTAFRILPLSVSMEYHKNYELTPVQRKTNIGSFLCSKQVFLCVCMCVCILN